MKLYEISQEIEDAIEAAVDQDTGEIVDEALAEKLDELWIKHEEKCLSVACVVKGIRAEAEAVSEEIRRLQARKRVCENDVGRLSEYLRRNIEPGAKMRDARAVISWRRSESVVIEDEAILPAHWWRVRREPEKSKIKDALKAGSEVAGARLETRHNLQVR